MDTQQTYFGSGIRPQHLETQALGMIAQHFPRYPTLALGSHTSEIHTETQALVPNYTTHNMCFVGSDPSAWVANETFTETQAVVAEHLPEKCGILATT